MREDFNYAVDFKGKLISIDPMTFQVKEIIKSHFKAEKSIGVFNYLVESCGILYLVNKVIHINTSSLYDED